MSGMSGIHERHRDWRAVTVAAFAFLIAAGLAAYAAAASYESVSSLAAAHHVPLPYLNPVGIDGGLFGVIALDIALTWMGQPIGWLRLAARLFAAGTVAANFAAGWPDTAGATLRVAAPVLFVIIAEVARTRLLRAHRAQRGKTGVPARRWLLAPGPTFRLWRRMQLWDIADYAAAVDMELSRLHAIERLCSLYRTRDWQRAVPGDLAWMLGQGVRMTAALEAVAQLCAPPAALLTPAAGGARRRVTGARKPARKRPAGGDEIDTHAAALNILLAEPEISGSELGRRLGKTSGYGRILKARLTAPSPDTGQIPAVRDTAG